MRVNEFTHYKLELSNLDTGDFEDVYFAVKSEKTDDEWRCIIGEYLHKHCRDPKSIVSNFVRILYYNYTGPKPLYIKQKNYRLLEQMEKFFSSNQNANQKVDVDSLTSFIESLSALDTFWFFSLNREISDQIDDLEELDITFIE